MANWSIEKTYSASDLFVHVVPLAEGGPNSMRSEVLLNAFCTEAVAVVGPTPAFVKGTGLVRTELDALMERAGLRYAETVPSETISPTVLHMSQEQS